MESPKKMTGLTSDEVLISRKKHGTNQLSPPLREPLWKLFFRKFDSPVIRILLIAAFLSLAISFFHKEFSETIGIFLAIILATGIAFWFEMDANKKFNILNQVNNETLYKTFRDGLIGEVPKHAIVVGDVVILGAGEEVPADGELLESVALQADESCLTGWSVPAQKAVAAGAIDSGTAYRCNQLLRGTSIMDGHCVYQVTSVGDDTEFGKIARSSAEISGEETPLNQQLDRLAKLIGAVGFGLAAFTFMALFVKETLLGEINYSFAQLWLLAGLIAGLLISLVKIWLPSIYDALELAGKPHPLPLCITRWSWLRWMGTGVVTTILLGAIGWAAGINPLLSESWITIETAEKILQYFMVSVTLIVVAVPEGLPMSVTLSLALSMRKMLKSNNLVRKMHACETMGAATVICTDKTGTLTQNQMRVVETHFPAAPSLAGQMEPTGGIPGRIVAESLAINSTAYLDFSDATKPKPLGNFTEAALLLWLHELEINYLTLRDQVVILEQLPFSTERKIMASLVFSKHLNKKILYVKGAPEIVLAESETIQASGGKSETGNRRPDIEGLLSLYQSKALRTIGFACEIVDDEAERIKDGMLINHHLTFTGIAAISDPVRPDVPMAVQTCLQAGIDVKIVTGDTPGTAREIGKQIGIWMTGDSNDQIITGDEFQLLDDEEAQTRSPLIKIMCRARPSHKQRFVQMLQRNGSVVAVTGDGTNDAPALNFAHVGLSMGSGTSVAKEASDITLIDDSFASITNAVLWGRTVYRNICRFIVFQLTINISALIIVFIGALFGGKLPLTVTQLLWVNLIMDTFAAGALASLPPDRSVMQEKPRNRHAFIVNKKMARSILGIGLLFVAMLLGLLHLFDRTDLFFTHEPGTSLKELTVFFTVFVMLQFWNMFNAKAFFTNKTAFYNLKGSVGFLVVGLVIVAGQFLIVEFGGSVFRTVPLTPAEWLGIIAATSVVLWVGEIYRFSTRLIKRNQTNWR